MTASSSKRVYVSGLATLALVFGLIVGTGRYALASATPTCKGQPATIVGTDEGELLEGTAESDVIVGLGGGDSIYGHDGEDVLCGGRDDDFVLGGGHDDYVAGGAGDDQLWGEHDVGGNGWNDRLAGGPHSATGGDWVIFTRSVTVNLEGGTATGDGQDRIRNVENVMGSAEDDTLIGDDRPNYLVGGRGDDTLWGRDDNDAINGKLGDDALFGGGGVWDWLLYFGARDEVTVDLEQRATWIGSEFDQHSGFELVVGSPHDDTLLGDGRINYLAGRGGDDWLNGRDGHDMATFYTPVRANLAEGIARGRDRHLGPNREGTDQLRNMEGLWGSGKRAPDILIGDGGSNLLRGYGGADKIKGRAGDDYVLVESGTESIEGDSGSYDILDFFFWPRGVSLDLGSSANVTGGSITGMEGALGSQYGDVLKGDSGANYLFGQDGSDTLLGRAGRDALEGGRGANEIFGGPHADRCVQATSKTECELALAAPPHPLFVVGDILSRAERRYK